MATREYNVPVGTDLIDAVGNGWQIGGIQINNPSGSWLRVSGIEQYVPPYTLGWTFPITPTQASISVRFVDSPSGTPSELVGNPVTVTLFDTTVPASPGNASGAAGQQQPGAAPLSSYDADIDAVESGAAPVTFIAAVPGTIIVPRQVLLSYSYNRMAFSDSLAPRTPVVLAIVEGGGGTFQELWISPESPFAYVPVIDGLKTTTPGQSLGYVAATVPGGGKQGIHFRYEYFRITQ